MVIGSHISIITLNVNGLNVPTKRQGLAELIQKQDPWACYLQETHLRPRDTHRLKVRSWKKILHANGNQKKVRVAKLIYDKIDFKIKHFTRDIERSHIMIKGPIQEEATAIICIYSPNRGAHQYIRQMLKTVKGEINSNTVTVGDFNTLLTWSSRQKINKETEALNDTLDPLDRFIQKQ